MHIPEGIFKSYDIRGIYSDELNEENAVVIAAAIYKFFQQKQNKDKLKILVGYDCRISSPAISKAVISTLANLGADVTDAGIVATPTFYFGVSNLGFDGGIQITASHNPKEYNGMKFVIVTDKGVIKIGKSTGMDEIKRLALKESQELEILSQEKGKVERLENLVAKEVENAFKIAGQTEIKPFKIVADPANAMGATYIEELFKHIPGELIKMNFELDGNFPVHQPDPLQPENVKDLQKRVIEENADLGLAPDGDGDRIMFIDEKGEFVSPAVITAMIASKILKKNPGGKILFDIRYILTPKKVVEELGGKTLITKVGHAFITEAMQKEGGVFAGESSGHYYFRQTGGAESAVTAILIIFQMMSESGKKLSELVAEFRKSEESGEINFRVKNAPEI
ncbi:phosphomannomutase/phosphoglucomutase, partial [Candidatus Daviesbacteria bacterium]|nr:phosphomannomutase/phosphoglucomutase [Candidatus Daviesbacteria bacterium]